MLSLLRLYTHLFQREVKMVCRMPADSLNPVLFFIIVVSLFPIAMEPEPRLLQQLAPAIIWVTVLLAGLLSMHRLFYQEWVEHTLNQFLLSPYPLSLIVLGKVIVHWLLTMGPIILVTPLAALMFGMAMHTFFVLIGTLLLGSPVLILLGGIASALTLQQHNNGILISLLVLPLFIPVLIFGTIATMSADSGMAVNGYFAVMTALLLLSISLAPWAIAASLRLGL